jgi:hypothetical protein
MYSCLRAHRALVSFRTRFLWRVAALLLIATLFGSFAHAQHEQVLGLAGANWTGDASTQGGLDDGLAGDKDTMTVSADGVLGFPASVSLAVNLTRDYSRNLQVAIWIGYRSNTQQAKVGTILWDGKPLSSCYGYGALEQLLTRKIIVNTSDFNFSPGSHTVTIQATNDVANDADFLEVDAIKIAPVGPYHGDDPHPAVNWLVVTGGETSTAESDNVAKLVSEISALSATPVSLVTVSQLTAQQRANYNLILVGRYATNTLAKQVLNAQGISDPFAADADFIKQQGYVAGVYPNGVTPGLKVILAIGWNELGSAYAVSHLRTHLQYANGLPYLDLEGTPQSFTKYEVVRKPNLEERGIYYNIAYGISYGALTPDNWNEAQWQYWIDKQVCAQLTHVYFFLWGSVELYTPKSPLSNTLRNRVLHQNLIKMIDYAHRRGLKVAYQFSPTHIPTDIHHNIVTAVPNAAGVYPTYNDSFLCTGETGQLASGQYTWNGSLEVMKDLYGNEMEQFKKVDQFILWFYDPGGCLCDATRHNCKGLQAERLMQQVDAFSQLALQKNPNAKFTIVGWPIWTLEPSLGISYRNALLSSLKTYFASSMDRVSWLDSVQPSNSTLIEAQAQGFRLNSFVYPTNIETGYPFLIPMLDFLKAQMAASKARQVSAIHCMRIEEGGKFPNTFISAQFFWNLDLSKEEAVRQYSRWIANTNSDAADKIYQALMLLDTFMANGTASQNHETKGAQIQSLIESALQSLSTAKQQELEWLLTTSRAVALLGKAVENSSQVSALATQYVALLNASPSFKPCAAVGASVFPTYVTWIATGWNNANF